MQDCPRLSTPCYVSEYCRPEQESNGIKDNAWDLVGYHRLSRIFKTRDKLRSHLDRACVISYFSFEYIKPLSNYSYHLEKSQ